jgi:hypothetical protein
MPPVFAEQSNGRTTINVNLDDPSVHRDVKEFLVKTVIDDPCNFKPHAYDTFVLYNVLFCNAVQEQVRIKLPVCRQTVAVPIVKKVEKKFSRVTYEFDSVWPIQVFGIGTRPS